MGYATDVKVLAGLLACVLVVGCSGDDDDGDSGTPTFAAGTTVTPAGDFTEIASGQQEGVTWQLAHAPASDGGTCWRFTSQPELVATSEACAAPPGDENQPPEFAVEFPFTTDGTGVADAVVVTSTVDIEDAEFAFADGSRAEPVTSTFNNGTGALVWIGPTDPAIGALTITTADGTTLHCGPGTITDPAEIANLDPAELAEQRSFPWACVG